MKKRTCILYTEKKSDENHVFPRIIDEIIHDKYFILINLINLDEKLQPNHKLITKQTTLKEADDTVT